MSPAELRALMATAERQSGETTEQYTARAIAEHQLSSWRIWLPGLLDEAEMPAMKRLPAEIRRNMQAAGISQRALAAAIGVTESSISQQLSAGSNMSLRYVDRLLVAIAALSGGIPAPTPEAIHD